MRERGPSRVTSLLAALALAVAGLAWAQEEADGEALYERHCASCHMEDGSGMGDFPALDGNEVVTGDPRGAIEPPLVGPGAMPSFATTLNDAQIAAVVSHIRTSWSNDAGPVDAQQVADVRAAVGAPSPEGEDGAAVDGEAQAADFAWEGRGAEAYGEYCAACHREDGSGVEGAYPALADNPFVTADARAVVHLPLFGRGGMPALGGSLDDASLAAVVNHIRTSWGNDAPTIEPDLVAEVREAGSQPDEPVEDGAAEEPEGEGDDEDGGGVLDRPGAGD